MNSNQQNNFIIGLENGHLMNRRDRILHLAPMIEPVKADDVNNTWCILPEIWNHPLSCDKIYKDMPDDSIIYMLKGKATNLIKIGLTVNLDRRKSEIERDTSQEIDILKCWTGGYHVELALHVLLSKSREYLEWFRPTPSVLTVLKYA